MIIFADVDLNRVTRQACDAVYFNKGENCIAAGRLFVEETIHDEFVDRVVELTKKMTIGDPVRLNFINNFAKKNGKFFSLFS